MNQILQTILFFKWPKVETGQTNGFYNGVYFSDLECQGAKKGHFGPKMCFFFVWNPFQRSKTLKSVPNFFYTFLGYGIWDIFINLE